MDGAPESSAREDKASALCIAQCPSDTAHAAKVLAGQLGPGPFAMVCLFASPTADFTTLAREANAAYPGAEVLACTTAGELGRDGYDEGTIVAIGFRRDLFETKTLTIENLDQIDEQVLIDRLIQDRVRLNHSGAQMPHEFAFVLVDGLSQMEEHLAAVLSSGLGPMPLFGGSSGDGVAFSATYLSRNGTVYQNTALVALVRTHCPVEVFSLDHFVPSETRMVVTRADPANRVVHEINAEPAAKEYARLLGKDPNQLGPFTFAAHPVVVRLGESHHVRAIQRVSDDGDLIFFSAINEGMVLTLADKQDIASHLDQGLSDLEHAGAPDHILGCDCILRRIESGESQKTREISEILSKHNVVGFSTYGEQIGALHVNQTFTGVAIYPAKTGDTE